MSLCSVLGPVDPGDVGFTLTHEHLFLDFTKCTQKPLPQYCEDSLGELDLKMENMNRIIKFP